MKKANKIFIILIGMILLTSAFVGIITRKSFYDNVHVKNLIDGINSYEVSLSEKSDYTKIYFDDDIDNLAQLQQKSDIIVKIKPRDRKVLNQAVLTKVEILDSYKGNVKKGDSIYVYEPVTIRNEQYVTRNGYIIMDDEREFIFFLRNLKIPGGYVYKGIEEKSYLPVSITYGKFITSNTNTHIIKENKLKFNIVKKMDIITTDLQTLKNYNKIKEDVLKFYQF